MKSTIAAAGMAWLGNTQHAFALGTQSPLTGKTWQGWNPGELQVHFIYTGVGESMFYIFPDGTTLLLDCGDHTAINRGKLAVHVLPNGNRHAGEWIARYVERVNPHTTQVDYMMLSHYHNDHGGCKKFHAGTVEHNGKQYYLSGFMQAAETLSFGKAIDRGWPDYTDPIPLVINDGGVLEQMKDFYAYMTNERGLQVERFNVGATNQIKQLHDPAKYANFSIFNLCGNGRIASRDGKVTDLYAERKKNPPTSFNENGMSMGMVMSYGDFRFFTAGDFSDKWKLADGTVFEIEDALADVCGKAHVAKINHHGHYSMPEKLVKALQSRVYVSCVWDQLHNVAPVMERLASRKLYPGDRLICPGIMPSERRIEDAGKPWTSSIATESYEGSHIVLTVQPNCTDYSITFISAEDEDMRIKSVIPFTI